MSLCRARKDLVLLSQNGGVVLVVGELPLHFCTYGVGVSGSWELLKSGLGEICFRPIFPVLVPLLTAHGGSQTSFVSNFK